MLRCITSRGNTSKFELNDNFSVQLVEENALKQFLLFTVDLYIFFSVVTNDSVAQNFMKFLYHTKSMSHISGI